MPTSTKNPDGTYTLQAAPSANPTANPNANYFNQFQVPGQTPTLPTVPPPSSSTVSTNAMGAQPYNLAPTTPLPPVAVAPQVQPQQAGQQQNGQTQNGQTQQTQQPGVADNLNSIFTSLTGKDAATNAAVTTAEAPYQQQLNDINTQIAMHQADSIARQEQILRSGGDTSFQAGEGQRVARTDAIESLKLSALQSGLQGNIALAEKQATAAVDAQFAQKQQDLETAKTNIYNNYDTFTAAEKKQADAALLRIDANDAFVKAQKADQNEIYQIALTALQYGAPSDVIQKIQSASTREDALALGGTYLRDPKAKYDVESARLDNLIKKAQLDQIGQPSAADKKATEAAMQQAKDAIPTIQDKINQIDSLVKSPGLDSAVGPNPLARISILDKVTGAQQSFIAGVSQLLNKETIDTLLNVKAQGGTFGALSDQERLLLQSAASKIGTWQILNDKGQVTGYNIDETSFKNELNTIKDLAQRAMAKAQGQLITPSEKKVLDQVWGSTSDTTFNASNYFGK